MSRRNEAIPQGRKELLFWLNSLCSAEYPTVESLRDGAAYCTLIEAAMSRISENCEATNAPGCNNISQRAHRAVNALGKIDWSATPAVCEVMDAAADHRRVRDACTRNMHVLQELLRYCVPQEHALEIDVVRLASGKLQDHLKLLQWLFNFMSKVLPSYSKKSLENRTSQKARELEGVKLNRAAKLLERRNHSEPSRDVSSRLSVGMANTDTTTPPHSGNRGAKSEKQSRPSTSRRSSSQNQQSAPAFQGAESRRSPASARGVTDPSSQGTAGEIPGALSFYQKGSAIVPSSMRDTLVQLRVQIENLESLTFRNHSRHQSSLTRVQNECTTSELSVTGDTEGLPPCGTLSLHRLGDLLEIRDILTQRCMGAEALIAEYNSCSSRSFFGS